jgi:hypothetical protein
MRVPRMIKLIKDSINFIQLQELIGNSFFLFKNKKKYILEEKILILYSTFILFFGKKKKNKN